MTMTPPTRAGASIRRPSSAPPPAGLSPEVDRRRVARALGAVMVLAVAVRLLSFPLAENKQADAPMRALIAERMNADPAAAADPRSFCQFGPLPIELMRPFMAFDADARRSSRLLSLLTGLAVFWPFFSLARRLVAGGARSDGGGAGGVGPGAAVGPVVAVGPALVVAGVALALSPLHIQLSTTAGSEALYLFLLLAALDRLHIAVSLGRRRDYVFAGLLTSLCAVTRYDTWLAVPVTAVALLLLGRDTSSSSSSSLRPGFGNVALFIATAALLPAAYLGWSWFTSGDPFFFARYITRDHVSMSQAATARLGTGLARLRQLGIWIVSFAAAMTPLALLAAGVAARRWRDWSPATRVVLAAALAPPAAYLAKGLLLGDFEPLPRFAVAPGAVLLPLAASALLSVPFFARPSVSLRVAVTGVVGGAVALALAASALAFARPGRIWAGAESITPLTRLDHEDRQLASFLLRHRAASEGVFIDTFGYVDIAITHAARVPASLSATLVHTRAPAGTLAASRTQTGASWFAFHDQSWGKTLPPDWPARSERFGGWRLGYVGDQSRGRAGTDDAAQR